MYKVSSYGKMIADSGRMDPYVNAMRAAIKPGSVVMDLGCGPGVFAMLACEMGARRVYAVEPSSMIQVARDAAAANGLSERIEFFHNFSTRISLPEPADVIVSDLHGPLPWHEQHIPSIRDVRQRLLAKDGVLIPQRDIVWAAIAEVPEEFEELVGPWEDKRYGIDLSVGRALVTNGWIKTMIKPENLLMEPKHLQTLDYHQIENANLNAAISFTVERAGTAHALAVWFDSELFNGFSFSNSPSSPELIYGNSLFLFPEGFAVAAGDQIEAKLTAHLIRSEYIWSWEARILDQGHPERCIADFKQSSFLGSPIAADEMKKRAVNHTPSLTQIGQIQKFVFPMMDGTTSIETIAGKLAAQFPNWFPDYDSALAYVAQLSTDYGQ
ncbi:MAG TPA: class I SAM-dependent methyltransferase [Pyrinomonadaceae bacterium]|nr:class I SAM-dependent methyltransferase [Pyrinomonadaceae bacterium]